MIHTDKTNIERELGELKINLKDGADIAIIDSITDYPYIENDFSDEKKIEMITFHFENILKILGLNLKDDSINKTPYRYAKMFVKELFSGLKHENFPKITTQKNKFKYDQMLVEANIKIQSVCEHHFVPILGYCHIAYFPGDKVIGLSKLNRIGQYFARRPQVQERMTRQIKECLVEILDCEDVAVVIDALHLCVRMRGIQDSNALTRTSDFGGRFLQNDIRNEFLSTIPNLKDLKI